MRSASPVSVDLDPADFQTQTHSLANYFAQLATHSANSVHGGSGATVPTSASTQTAGGAGLTEWRIDVEQLVVCVGGKAATLAAQSDLLLYSGNSLLDAVGKSAKASLIAVNAAGVISLAFAVGAGALTGSEKSVGATALQAAAGAGNDWIQVAECTINRTLDTVVTQTQDNSQRPILGVTVDKSFGVFTG